ncbi:Biotin synthase [Lachnospiraceae bacterium TWA4]|nr:Biotin synthase [Lachnospiraceae bacterium TWA4]
MINLQELTKNVLDGQLINRKEALDLYEQPLEDLCKSANQIREHFCANTFDMCTIINGKSGHCSENCKFCAQSAHHHTSIQEYALLSSEEIVKEARHNHEQGVLRYSIVTSGKRLSDDEIDKMCEAVRKIKSEVGISVCISFGLLNEAQYRKLKEAGVTRVHNNIETSRRNFPNVCTTHTFEDKLSAIRAAKAAGLEVCSGGIMGLGECIEDRIDMAFTLRELGIKSIPVNMLNPIPGTPFETNQKLTNEDMRRIVAVFRFILPDASIRLAGGRGLIPDKGRGCFLSGANAAISGDMLTTAGITVQTDKELLHELGYEVKLI